MISQKILLWGWFGFENLGDDLLLDTMIQSLNSPERMITIPIHTTYAIKEENVKQVSRGYKELLKGALYNDFLIIGPGGLFPFDNPKKVLLYFVIVLLWKLRGRKVVFFGIGISKQLSSMSRRLWKSMAMLSDLFITRSPGVIEAIGLKETSKIHTMADTVFASDMEFAKCEYADKIGIFTANLRQPGMDDAYEVFVKTWQEVVSSMLDRGLCIDLIAFTKNTDDQLIADIVSAFSERGGGYAPCDTRTRWMRLKNCRNIKLQYLCDFTHWFYHCLRVCRPFQLHMGRKYIRLLRKADCQSMCRSGTASRKNTMGMSKTCQLMR